jgi:hypothetical protein
MVTEIDYYVTLGVERTATDAEIKKAFRRRAHQGHPDPHPELGVRQLDRRVAPADAVGDRVVVERQGDREPRQIRHPGMVATCGAASG